ncbi:MAG TPA: hypothetical protein VMS71_02315, partial [Candidatus Acidoferrum sp.]|nr:hypothetical protein [Candidatus Acidoferrum sp.]
MQNQIGTLIRTTLLVLMLAATVAAGPQLRISHGNFTLPCYGAVKTYSIYADSLAGNISSFKLVIAVNENSFAVISTEPGDFVKSCNWEYFTTRLIHGDFPNHPEYNTATTGLLEITGFASATQAGAPTCFGGADALELAKVKLLVGYQGHWGHWAPAECAFQPLSFFWRGCTDNRLLSRDGDTVFTASTVRDYYDLPGDTSLYVFPGFGAPGNACVAEPETTMVSLLGAVNSGFELMCGEELCTGDINLNGFPYESADLVMYSNYFTIGLPAFMPYPEGSIAQSDINHDGIPLSVADMVYMSRIIIGDIAAFSRPNPLSTNSVLLTLDRRRTGVEASLTTDAPLAAAYLRLTSTDGRTFSRPDLDGLDNTAAAGKIGDTTTVLWFHQDGSTALPSGTRRLFELEADHIQVAELTAVDQFGRTLAAKVVENSLPTTMSLAQNYPNPFNP